MGNCCSVKFDEYNENEKPYQIILYYIKYIGCLKLRKGEYYYYFRMNNNNEIVCEYYNDNTNYSLASGILKNDEHVITRIKDVQTLNYFIDFRDDKELYNLLKKNKCIKN